jgi:hypothetical protein
MATQTNIYHRVLTITEDYFGPAAPRFISRLVTNHLGKPAAKLTSSDIPQLVVWIRLAATVITDNELLVAEYLQRLEKLSHSPQPNAGHNPQANGMSDKSNHHATIL